ncbi:hypothetical protein POMI540_1806 [Schizosaccharomyces pombe]
MESSLDRPNFDEFVAKLLIHESKKKNKSFVDHGYIEKEKTKLRPNKVFLNNMVRNVQSHNRGINNRRRDQKRKQLINIKQDNDLNVSSERLSRRIDVPRPTSKKKRPSKETPDLDEPGSREKRVSQKGAIKN